MPKRWVVQAGVIALGAVVAVGTLERGTYVARTPLVQRVAEGDSAAREKLSSLVSASKPSSAVASRGGLDSGIEHPRVDFWVNRLSTTMSDGFKVSLERMKNYASMITGKLQAKDMPTDLAYLALIESEFNPNARSRVQAVGMWQFMKGTAKQFGLAVGKGVDERKDPARATDAAITYLSSLHDRLGSWYLAAAAYNSGEGTVLRALKKVTGRTQGTDADFFQIMPELPKETQDYVPKLIAAARIGADPAKYGINLDSASTTKTAAIARPTTATKSKRPAKPVKVAKAAASRRRSAHATRSAHKAPSARSGKSHRAR